MSEIQRPKGIWKLFVHLTGVPSRRWHQTALYHKEFHINQVLRLLRGTTYLEIGVRDGDCFHKIRAPRKIGVDPVRQRFQQLASNENYFEMTSDDFFRDRANEVLRDDKVDVALVDGLHEFKQTLQDILNIEKFMKPHGVVFVHDCDPPSRARSEVRDGGRWFGDVWKVPFYLKKCRPDLQFYTLNCDTGLGRISGFSPRRAVPVATRELIDEVGCCDYSVFERGREATLRLHSPLLAALKYFCRRP